MELPARAAFNSSVLLPEKKNKVLMSKSKKKNILKKKERGSTGTMNKPLNKNKIYELNIIRTKIHL